MYKQISLKNKEEKFLKFEIKLAIAFVVFIVVIFLSFNIGNLIAYGDGGLIVSAISLLSGVIVFCTLTIIDAMKHLFKNKN